MPQLSVGGAGAVGMSGLVNGVNYNLLFGGETTSDATASILAALYSSSSSQPTTTFVSSGNPITDPKLAQSEQTTGVAQEALQPTIARAITAFKTAVTNATSIQSALLNPNVQQVLLTANGLSSYIGQTALAQKVLLSDPSDPNSLVNKLNNSSWLNTVQTYDFAKNGLAELKNPKVIAALSNAYAEVQWRQGLDQATPGLANALTFLGQASSIKTADDVLGNYTNFEVVTTALGIPQTIVFQDQTAQESAISSHLDIAKLQDRSYVTSLTDQYLLTMQEQKQSSGSSGSSLTSLAETAASGLVV
jgi:Protein of unknown function (DUF1217)